MRSGARNLNQLHGAVSARAVESWSPCEGISILHGEYQHVLADLPDGCVDLVITDPPYGTTALEWDDVPDFEIFWTIMNRLLKSTGVLISFCAQPFTTDRINSNRKQFRYELIWHKTLPVGFLDSKVRPLRAHENIAVFARKLKASTYNPQMSAGTPYKGRSTNSAVQHYGAVKRCIADNLGTRYPQSVVTQQFTSTSATPNTEALGIAGMANSHLQQSRRACT
jgi:site-specific DNA-methyltransferase (adenine-specific)